MPPAARITDMHVCPMVREWSRTSAVRFCRRAARPY